MTKCYVCGGRCEKDVIHGAYVYWKCTDCFTSQVLPQPSETELRQYYDSFHLSETAGGVYDEVEDRMKEDFPAKTSKVFAHALSGHLRLLDVGCGKGFFVKAALNAGVLAEGIDISRTGVEYAVRTLGVRATLGRIEDQQQWREAFDVVTFWATVEHLVDPLSILRVIHDVLKPGGFIFCDTGLGNCAFEHFLPGHNQWYDAPQHVFVFSRGGLVTLLEKAGFEIIDVDTNYDRSSLRRYVRWIRHSALCLMGGLILIPLLGTRGFRKMRQEAKWPIGRLISVVAQKMEP